MARLEYSRPPESLAEELREVARDAKALRNELKRQNRLPDEFPAEPLSDLLEQLQTLNEGTAEGCRQPLSLARARLPQIRREHILTEARSAGQEKQGEAPPPLTRGMAVDKLLTALIGSVTTALDEYRRLAGEALAEESDTAPSQRLDQDAPDVKAADAAAAKAETVLGEAQKKAGDILRPDSAKGDDLKRQLSDAKRLFRLSRIELKMPAFVPEWYRGTVAAIKDYPALLKKTASALRVGADIADRANGVLSRFGDRMVKAVTDTVRDAAGQLDAFAKGREAARRKPDSGAAPSPGTPPEDFDLEKVYEMILAGHEPPASWRPWIYELDFSYVLLPDIAPLRNLFKLNSLRILDSNLPSFSDIAHLQFLERLSLHGTNVKSIEFLEGCRKIKHLDLSRTRVWNISYISFLRYINYLDISDTPVEDVSSLAGLNYLYKINLSKTRIVDIAPLSSVDSVIEVNLNYTHISTVAPFSKLSKINALFLQRTYVHDLLPLEALSDLQVLHVAGTKVSDLSPISKCESLRSLDISSTNVLDLHPLKNLTKLRRLHAALLNISDLSPLASLRGLEILDLRGGSASDLTQIAMLPNLKHVYVEKERIQTLARTLGREGVVTEGPWVERVQIDE